MKVNEIRNMKVALTHAGKFHADDVFGAAFKNYKSKAGNYKK